MSKIKICLDAGHVGSKYNQSPVVKTYYESAMVWKLHLKLKAELETRGFEVITTRADIDTDLGVYERGAASKGCNVFISLHSNACSTESVDYPVVYRAYDNLNDVDVLALQIAKKIGELMGTNQAGRTATRKNSAGGEYYGVLRGARAVGTPFYMLIEHSFHTNTAATKWLSVDANLDKLAVAEAELLADYFGVNDTPKTEIMGEAHATAQQMALFCRSKNAEPKLTSCTLEQLAEIFLEEGKAEGVRGDVAFAQSLHETGYFKFGGIVLPSQNNYAGIGALNGNATGQAATFPDPRTGVRAQIQHLKAYASTEPLVNTCVDPRFSLVARGSAPYVEWLGAADNPNGKGWAVPGSGYGANVVKLLGQIMAQEAPESPSPAPEPDPLANYPDWQRNGLTALVKAGVINSPDYWANKFGEAIKVGEIIGILGKMMEQPTE
ncbi:MAG: N-acetylmuramoyl-L-alanine amidase [Gemmiger sp.]|jgi:N-acetylmuramoyl-L-alanine amidase|uniref:N-acetylmuramoyl-L-alanine amidase n=1 Tax=Gemmiger sp. TaxID=2049027 RepID=UPI002E76C4FA|nr:N-acetylmuramoyl-L-alanine amidase [Gemmiger sp.]MEE0800749.1 N-acetylmuramoyl-L-alanine amidase [Gemmiger sp.]